MNVKILLGVASTLLACSLFPQVVGSKVLTTSAKGVEWSCFIPDSPSQLRGMLIIVGGHNVDVRKCTNEKGLQSYARRMRFGIIVPMFRDSQSDGPDNGTGDSLLAALKSFASKSQHPEVEFVPWCAQGFSHGASWVYRLPMWKPDRVIATAPGHGCGWSGSTNAAMLKTPCLMIHSEGDDVCS